MVMMAAKAKSDTIMWKTLGYIESIYLYFYANYYSMFHITWTTFKFNKNQLGTVSMFVMISVLWIIINVLIKSLTKNLLSKEFHCRTTDHN